MQQVIIMKIIKRLLYGVKKIILKSAGTGVCFGFGAGISCIEKVIFGELL